MFSYWSKSIDSEHMNQCVAHFGLNRSTTGQFEWTTQDPKKRNEMSETHKQPLTVKFFSFTFFVHLSSRPSCPISISSSIIFHRFAFGMRNGRGPIRILFYYFFTRRCFVRFFPFNYAIAARTLFICHYFFSVDGFDCVVSVGRLLSTAISYCLRQRA